MLTPELGLASGAAVGFLSGLAGLGGSILLIPVLLAAPALFGLPPLSPHHVGGITAVQVLSAATVGLWAHARNRTVAPALVWSVGLAALASGFPPAPSWARPWESFCWAHSPAPWAKPSPVRCPGASPCPWPSGGAGASPLGARLSARVPVRTLRLVIAVVIGLATIQIGQRAW